MKTLEISIHWTPPHGMPFFAAWRMALADGTLFNLWLGRLGFEVAVRQRSRLQKAD